MDELIELIEYLRAVRILRLVEGGMAANEPDPNCIAAADALQSLAAERDALRDQIEGMEYRAKGNAEAAQFQTDLLAQVTEQRNSARAENARLTALVQAQGDALRRAGGVFMDYAQLHMRKGTEDGRAKARRNLDEAHAIEAALSSDADPDLETGCADDCSHLATAFRALKESRHD